MHTAVPLPVPCKPTPWNKGRRRRVCDGIGLRLPARRMALRDNRGNLDYRCPSALAHTLIIQLHNSV
jgi:hypothetical protein